jgi:dihydrofolate reductase
MTSIIVATDLNNGIGLNNKLLAKLTDDLKFFKATTLNKPMIMGRKTFESLPGKLPKRKHIIMSKSYQIDDTEISVYSDLREAVADHEHLDPMIIGGGEIYKEALRLDLVDIIYQTLILDKFEADTHFPDIPSNFILSSSVGYGKDDNNESNFIINTFVKID